MTTALQGLRSFWNSSNNIILQKRANKKTIKKYILHCPLCKHGQIEELSDYDIEEDILLPCNNCKEYQELKRFNLIIK